MMILTFADGVSAWGPLVVLIAIAVVFGVGTVIASTLIGPTRTGPTKESVYESGMKPIGTARKRFNIRFYILAIAFLIFDVEIVFLYPWATVFPNLAADSGLAGQFLARIIFFIATSVVAYIYAWRKGVFRYD